jgi:hypothetical protein
MPLLFPSPPAPRGAVSHLRSARSGGAMMFLPGPRPAFRRQGAAMLQIVFGVLIIVLLAMLYLCLMNMQINLNELVNRFRKPPRE